MRKTIPVQKGAVRVRRAYFDCRFGQLHVRTAFSGTGGFDERTTLLCVHAPGGSGRLFDVLLPQVAADRSVYAPDLPGDGESDPAPESNAANAAAALNDLLNDLRVRSVDVLAVGEGAVVASELAKLSPGLVRKRFDLPAGDKAALESDAESFARRLHDIFN